MVKKTISVLLALTMVFLLSSPALANTIPTKSIQIHQVNGETIYEIETDTHKGVLVETGNNSVLVALTTKENLSQVMQVYVPLDKIDTTANNLWSSAFEYALNDATASETELFEVQNTSVSARASSTYVANAVKNRLAAANGAKCDQMLIYQNYKYSGYTLSVRLTRMNEAEKIQVTSFQAGMTGAGIAASIAGLLGIPVPAALAAILLIYEIASAAAEITQDIAVESWCGTSLHIKTGGVTPSGGSEVPCCTETWSSQHKYLLDVAEGDSSDLESALQEVSVEEVYGSSEWEYESAQVAEKAYEIYTT